MQDGRANGSSEGGGQGGVRAPHFMQKHRGCRILLRRLEVLIEAGELDSPGDSPLNDLGVHRRRALPLRWLRVLRRRWVARGRLRSGWRLRAVLGRVRVGHAAPCVEPLLQDIPLGSATGGEGIRWGSPSLIVAAAAQCGGLEAGRRRRPFGSQRTRSAGVHPVAKRGLKRHGETPSAR